MVRTPVTPAQVHVIGAAQIARLDRTRKEKDREPKHTQLWLMTSREAAKLSPLEFLQARRAEWGIENGLHHVLDVSGTEDLHLKVRDTHALHVLTLLNRLSVCLWRRTRSHKDLSYRSWCEQNKARPGWLLNLLRTDPTKPKW